MLEICGTLLLAPPAREPGRAHKCHCSSGGGGRARAVGVARVHSKPRSPPLLGWMHCCVLHQQCRRALRIGHWGSPVHWRHVHSRATAATPPTTPPTMAPVFVPPLELASSCPGQGGSSVTGLICTGATLKTAVSATRRGCWPHMHAGPTALSGVLNRHYNCQARAAHWPGCSPLRRQPLLEPWAPACKGGQWHETSESGQATAPQQACNCSTHRSAAPTLPHRSALPGKMASWTRG